MSTDIRINTFRKWLLEHQHRDDPVGDLAKDIATDEKHHGFKWNGTIKALRYRVMLRGGCDEAEAAVEAAWNEYRELRKEAQEGPAIRFEMIDGTPPAYPKVSAKGKYLVVCKGRHYEIPDHPIKVLGLLHHLAGKQ